MVSREYFTDVRKSFLAGFFAPKDITTHAYRRVRQTLEEKALSSQEQLPTLSDEHRTELGLRTRARTQDPPVRIAYLTGMAVGFFAPGSLVGNLVVGGYEYARKVYTKRKAVFTKEYTSSE